MRLRYWLIVAFMFLIAGYGNPLYADVMVERLTKSGGFKGMGASEFYEKESIQGIKKHVESKVNFTGKFLSKFAGDMKTSTIFRVDKDLIWEVNHKEKTYTERSISIPKTEEFEESSASYGGDEEEAERVSDKEDESETRIVKNELKVQETGEEKIINGFPCKQHIMTWLVETENIKTKERSKSLMTTDLWNTPETSKTERLKEEEITFGRAYLKKLGLDMSPEEMKAFGLSFMAGIVGASGLDIKKEMSKIKGYPIVMSVKWEAASEAVSGKGEKASGQEEEEIDLSKGIGSMFGGLMNQVKKDKSKESGEMEVVFDSYTEIKSIDTSQVSKKLFEVPEGYKKRSHEIQEDMPLFPFSP